MDYKQRISRTERRHSRLPWPGMVAITIIFCLAAVTIYRFKFHKISKPAPTHSTWTTPPANFRSIAEGLIVNCCRSFGLSDSIIVESTVSQVSGRAYKSFRQGWPAELPFLLFVQRLNDDVRPRNFQCDCQELSKQGRLDCSIKAGDTIGARVILDCGKKTNLADREVAIILDDLGAFSGDDIIKLIKSGFVFSYIARPDYYPTGEMVKLFARGNVTSILRLPGGNFRDRNSPSFGNPILKNALSRHPGAKSFIFDNSAPIDSQFTKSIIADARKAKLPYLYFSEKPLPVDKFAISRGVPIIRLPFAIDGSRHADGASFKAIRNVPASYDVAAGYKSELFRRLLSPDGPRQFAVCLSAEEISPEWLLSLRGTLAGLGVKLRPYMKLAQETDSL